MSKELRLLRRDAGFLVLQLLFPPLLLLVFGSVFSITLRRLPVAVQDLDETPASRRLVRELTANGYFTSTPATRPGELLDSGQTTAALSIPSGYARKLARGDGDRLQMLVDGSDGAARAAEGYLAQLPMGGLAHGDGALAAPPTVAVATWYNAGQDDAFFFIPGVIAVLIFGAPATFTLMSIVREKTSGTWHMLAAAPIDGVTLLTGKLVPYLAQGAVIAAALFALAVTLFHVPIRGPAGPLWVGTAFELLTGIGIGGTISALSKDDDDAWRLLLILVFLPCLVLSGFIYPLSSMPRPVQALSRLFPVRPYLELVRAVMLKNATLDQVATQLVQLCGFAVGALLLALVLLQHSRRATS
jgi:ABC-2 type transport system permease protein